MKIQAINYAVNNLAAQTTVSATKNNVLNSNFLSNEKFESVSGSLALAQMPNVNFSFGRKHYNYGQDDFDAYDNYSGPTPPQIELEKYRKSLQVQKNIDDENYLAAIEGKIDLARICRKQGNERDAFMLEESIRDLYKDLPKYQRDEAKSLIGNYNHDMAKYIDQDINK